MVGQKDLQSNRVEIGQVREATFDPVIGESVVLSLRVRSSSTQLAASNVGVVFTVEQTPWRVGTDDNGWASFTYKAERPGDVVVVATLDSVNDGPEADPLHTFRFKALAAGVWDDAQIQLNTDSVTVWGAETRFPRLTQSHTVKLSVANANSPLLGRDVCLGLKGYSSASELGLTVTPALGESRRLTSAGLSWQCRGTIGGAYALQLAASRLLMKSPVNAMSLGPVQQDKEDDLPVIESLTCDRPVTYTGYEVNALAKVVRSPGGQPFKGIKINWSFAGQALPVSTSDGSGVAQITFETRDAGEFDLVASQASRLPGTQIQRISVERLPTVLLRGIYAVPAVVRVGRPSDIKVQVVKGLTTPVAGILVRWMVNGNAVDQIYSNEEGWAQFRYVSTVAGDVAIAAAVDNPVGTVTVSTTVKVTPP